MNRSLPDRGEQWDDGPDKSPLLHSFLGPHRLRERFPDKFAFLEEEKRQRDRGDNAAFLETLTKELSPDIAINMIVPILVEDVHGNDYIDDQIILADPKDAERVARLHVKKSAFHVHRFMRGNSVFATRDIDLWKQQRRTLVEALLPISSLSNVMPIMVARAKFSAENRIPVNRPFNAFEYFSREAATQLHMALFGETQEYSESNVDSLRKAFDVVIEGSHLTGEDAWRRSINVMVQFTDDVLDHVRDDPSRVTPSQAVALQCPVLGPLGRVMYENVPTVEKNKMDPIQVRKQTVNVLSIAGFDTTSILFSFLTYEMCRNLGLQRRLQQEIDSIYNEIGDRSLTYADMHRFQFMTRVINETLRLWAPVPNGTYRELQFGECVQGIDGKTVSLKAGAQVWFPTWLLHRSEKCWGKDVLEFNPDREWLWSETWYGKSFGATVPVSYRFCPFTFPPRNCMGFNFSLLEARIVISTLFRKYDFSLDPNFDASSLKGSNKMTMSPRNGVWVLAIPRERMDRAAKM